MPLTLMFAPILVAAVAIATLVIAFITFNGESDWGKGASLVAL
jgi:Ca2+/H+ antiporter